VGCAPGAEPAQCSEDWPRRARAAATLPSCSGGRAAGVRALQVGSAISQPSVPVARRAVRLGRARAPRARRRRADGSRRRSGD